MTFFIREQPSTVQVEARGVDTPLTSFWGGIGAAFSREQVESNANFRVGRETIRTDDELAVDAARHMGADRIGQMVEDFNARARAAGMQERQMPEDMADLPSIFGPNFSKAVLDAARQDPEWGGPDVSPEAAEARTNERLKKEHRDLTETLNTMSGSTRWIADIVGGIGGATADIRNLPFLIAGGGTGSLARIMGREAMLNVAAEGVTMPDRFGMAERLDIPKPDVAMTLAYAAAGGAILGGAVEGLARGITYWRGTRVGQPNERVPVYDQQLNTDIAEDAIADLRHPFERVQAEAVETPPVSSAPAAAGGEVEAAEAALRVAQAHAMMSPTAANKSAERRATAELIKARERAAQASAPKEPPASSAVDDLQAAFDDAVARFRADPSPENHHAVNLADVAVRRAKSAPQAAEASPAAILRQEPERDLFDAPGARGGVGERQMDIEDLIRESREATPIDDDDPLPPQVERRLNTEAGGNRPLITHLKNNYGGISPTSRLGQELKAIGITPKDAPGLFRKAGAQGMDNIPASQEPHLAAILGQDGNGYLDEMALADAIAEEISGKPRPVNMDQENARIELNERRRAQEDREREMSAAYGRELDDMLFQAPEIPGWVDVPKEREAILEYRTDDLRTQIEMDGDRMIGDRSLSSILDELDADAEFADIAALCGTRRPA